MTDVLVLGAGPAGAATALRLARGGATVAVLHRPPPPGLPRVGETVPPSIVGPLARLGVWDAFRADGHAPAPGTVACWGGDEPYENEFILDPHGDGWHLDRARFDALLRRAAADAGVVLHALDPGDHVAPDGSGWCARVGGRALRAPFAVDATGRAALLARRGGVRRERPDRLVGLVGFGAAASTDPRTVLEAAEHGWWYGARLPQGRAVVAYFTDADLLPAGAAARGRRWVGLLRRTRLAAGVLDPGGASRVHTVAARTGAWSRPAGPTWVAVGDAARTLDPLSGQGLHAALTSAIRAAAAVLAPDRAVALARYRRWSAGEHEDHLRMRQAHYGRERRWPTSPFWRRRS